MLTAPPAGNSSRRLSTFSTSSCQPRAGGDGKHVTAFSLGFARPLHEFRFGSSERSFGHPGAGGSFAFADPDRDVTFAYVMNRLGFRIHDDPREMALRDALYRCI